MPDLQRTSRDVSPMEELTQDLIAELAEHRAAMYVLATELKRNTAAHLGSSGLLVGKLTGARIAKCPPLSDDEEA